MLPTIKIIKWLFLSVIPSQIYLKITKILRFDVKSFVNVASELQGVFFYFGMFDIVIF
jgi:hypothetical protein